MHQVLEEVHKGLKVRASPLLFMPRSDLTESVHKVVLQKSIPAQISQFILFSAGAGGALLRARCREVLRRRRCRQVIVSQLFFFFMSFESRVEGCKRL